MKLCNFRVGARWKFKDGYAPSCSPAVVLTLVEPSTADSIYVLFTDPTHSLGRCSSWCHNGGTCGPFGRAALARECEPVAETPLAPETP